MSGAHALIQSNLLGEALENAQLAVFVADEETRYIAVNSYACRMLGYAREELLDLHVVGVLVLLTVILSHAIVPFPTELVTAAAGFVYGFAAALPMLLLFWLASGMLAYWLARRYGRPLARRVVGTRRLRQAEEFVARGGPVPLISVRLVPFIPYNAICYAAGIVRVPEGRYAWTTLVGIAPLTALVAYLGSRLQEPDFGDWRIWAAVGGFTTLAILAQVLERRLRRPSRHT
jgi:uncharacterized membrane protein YdjX (TVP38/TMEM64 family)